MAKVTAVPAPAPTSASVSLSASVPVPPAPEKPASPHIVINYHRLLSDYDSFQLAVYVPSSSNTSSSVPSYHILSQPRRYALTSFGAVFRFCLADLAPLAPPYIHLLPIHASFDRADGPARVLQLHHIDSTRAAVHHFFIAQYSSEVHVSPHRFSLTQSDLPRFLFFALDSSVSTSHPRSKLTDSVSSSSDLPPALTVWPANSSNEITSVAPPQLSVYPATPKYRPPGVTLLYILDRLVVPPQTFALFMAFRHPTDVVLPYPLLPPNPKCPSLILSAQQSTFSLSVDITTNAVTTEPYVPTSQTAAIPFLLASQSEAAAALSPISKKHAIPPTVLVDTRAEPPTLIRTPSCHAHTLMVYYYPANVADGSANGLENGSGGGNGTSADIFVTPVDKMARAPTVLFAAKPYRSAHVFHVDLSALSPTAIAAGLIISAPGVEQLKWTPENGMQVVITPSDPRLLGPLDVELRLFYHRYDDLSDWAHWALHVTVETTKDQSTTEPSNDDMNNGKVDSNGIAAEPFSVVLPPGRPTHPGVLLFDLSELARFRNNHLNLDLVRLHKPLPDHANSQKLGPSMYRDVRRRIRLAGLRGEIHIVQGDLDVHSDPPDSKLLARNRFVRIRYRRFLPSDYEGWDLWTWDEQNPTDHQVAISPSGKPSQSWVEFCVDRAAFGAGSTLHLLPRRGGEQWLEKDEANRKWIASDVLPRYDSALRDGILSESDSNDRIPTFYIAQNSDIVFTTKRDLAATVVAQVVSVNSISIRTTVPIPWVCPPVSEDRRRPDGSTSNDYIVFKRLERKFSDEKDPALAAGRILRFTTMKEVSPIERIYEFAGKNVLFDEDYPVEQVAVVVQGFSPTVLNWHQKEDWDKYHYNDWLGWKYHPDHCIFKCFGPTADSMHVVLYDKPVGLAGRTAIPMRRIPEGCWKVTVNADLKGKYYKLLALGENKQLFPGVEVIDPYSRCNTSHTGRGLIFGEERTKIHPRPDIRPSETILYELHIRDVTIDEASGVSLRGKFKGLTEKGTHMKRPEPKRPEQPPLTPWEEEELPGVVPNHRQLDKYSTSLDHIAQMGVTAVQILPIQDFDNDESDEKSYRWGYMPVHFNSPDGWYATETATVARVTEFKMLVDAIHKAGMKVIMDVVYNHTAEDSNEFNLDARFSFNGLVPRYYYRTCGNTPVAHNGHSTCGKRGPDEPRCGGCYSNGSGCGNEFRSESPMGRKFILDSLKYWATEYKVDGFRFDLLGLIDVDTLAQASAELKLIDPKIMIYGEPWCGGLSPIETTEKGMQRSKGFGVFNNSFRDAIRGSPFDPEETFVMDGGRRDQVKAGIVGSIDDFCDEPFETINYVECHDNYTLWDHMRFYIRERSNVMTYTLDDMRRMHKLAALIVFTSQGVPFMQIGQEMCRTKFDIENSYESPDHVNMVQWSSKLTEWPVVRYYRGLILLRRAHPEVFSKESATEIRNDVIFYEDLGMPVPDGCIAFRIKGNRRQLLHRLRRTRTSESRANLEELSKKWSEVVVLLNATPATVTFHLPGGNENTLWYQVVDASRAGERDLRGPIIASVEVEGRSGAVLRRASEKDTSDAQLGLRLACVTDSYSSFQGDDVLSRYAVGLSKEMTEDEARLREEIKVSGSSMGSSSSRSRSGSTSAASLQSLQGSTTSSMLTGGARTPPFKPLSSASVAARRQHE